MKRILFIVFLSFAFLIPASAAQTKVEPTNTSTKTDFVFKDALQLNLKIQGSGLTINEILAQTHKTNLRSAIALLCVGLPLLSLGASLGVAFSFTFGLVVTLSVALGFGIPGLLFAIASLFFFYRASTISARLNTLAHRMQDEQDDLQLAFSVKLVK